MGSLVALLIIIVLALLIVQLGTNALLLTGMTLPVARFQAASAFFGVGFTTKEAELAVNHPVRRRVILYLIVAGKKLWESRPSEEGIVVLGIYHKGGEFEGAPGKNAVVAAGDTIMVYGSEEDVEKLVRGNPRPDDALDKLDQRATKVD